VYDCSLLMLSWLVTGIEKPVDDFDKQWPDHKEKLQKWKDKDIKTKAQTLAATAKLCGYIIGASN
jgi:hypothetical protein